MLIVENLENQREKKRIQADECACSYLHDCSSYSRQFLWESQQRGWKAGGAAEATSSFSRPVILQGPGWPLLPAVAGESLRVDSVVWSAEGLYCNCCFLSILSGGFHTSMD